MADQQGSNGEAQPQAAGAQARLSILTQYVKDMSFENPRAPYGVQQGTRPEIQIRVDVRTASLGDDRHEVVLDINVEAKAEDSPVFLVELAYGGLFELANIPADGMQMLLQVECPRLLFPFARRVVADATRDGGFPPLMIDPIDFFSLYRRKMQAAGAPSRIVRARPDVTALARPTAGKALQARHEARHVGDQLVEVSGARRGKAMGDELPDQLVQWLPEARLIEQQHRFVVITQLAQGDRVEDLVERAETARECHERVGLVDQVGLALEHRGGDPQLGQVALADLAVEQPLRDDAEDRPARVERGTGDHTHEADLAAAIDEPPTVRGDRRADGGGEFGIGGIEPEAGAAEHSDAERHPNGLAPHLALAHVLPAPCSCPGQRGSRRPPAGQLLGAYPRVVPFISS